MIATINPATGETLREFPALSADAIEEKLNASLDHLPLLSATPPGPPAPTPSKKPPKFWKPKSAISARS